MSRSHIFVFAVSAGLVLNLCIPPFQNPDEPQNFVGVLSYAHSSASPEEIEGDVIKLMDRNLWWKYIGSGRPEVLPETFAQMDFVQFHDFRSASNQFVFYQFVLGFLVRSIGFSDISHTYYFCRGVSFLFVLASLFILYGAFDKIARRQNKMYFLPMLFIVFLPQLFLTAISINPDTLSVFLGSVFFYAAVSLILGEFNTRHFAFLFIAAGMGLVTDKSNYFMIPMVLILSFFLLGSRKKPLHLSLIAVFILAFVLLMSWMAWYFPAQIYHSMNVIRTNIIDNTQGFTKLFSSSPFNRRFFIFLSDSFLLQFGWMAFKAHSLVYEIWRGVLLAATAGTAVFLVPAFLPKTIKFFKHKPNPVVFKLAIFCLIAVTIQILALWLSQGLRGDLPQGRYLFPVLFPAAFLLLLGIKSFFGVLYGKAGTTAMALLILFEFFFFSFALWRYIVPVFHLVLKSPHPGL